jgi:hypothetical protein
MPKSVVKSVYFTKEWKSPEFGTVYYFSVMFEDGTKGTFGSKTKEQNKFVQGQEAEYTAEEKIKNGANYVTIRPVQAAGSGYKVNPVYENKRTALKCAVELAANDKIGVGQISAFADNFLKYLNGSQTN